MLKLFLQIALVSAAVEKCSICLQAESTKGEQCVRACDHCRNPNVHMSCLHEFHQHRQVLDTKCPTCNQHLGPKFRVEFYTARLETLEANDERDKGQEAFILENLGIAHEKLGNAEKQRELLERALAILEREYGSDHREVAIILTNLGIAHGKLGNAEKHRELLERALVIKEREYGSDHREVAITLTNLGIAHGDLGNVEKKRELLERALAIFEHAFGPDHNHSKFVRKILANIS